jgi:hypothetical protein
MKCAHCGKGFSCGCQKTKATDGTTVHKTCVSEHNSKINVSKNNLTKTLNKAKSNLTR